MNSQMGNAGSRRHSAERPEKEVSQYLQDYLPLDAKPFEMLIRPIEFLARAEDLVLKNPKRGRVYRPVERSIQDQPKRQFDVFRVNPQNGDLIHIKDAELQLAVQQAQERANQCV